MNLINICDVHIQINNCLSGAVVSAPSWLTELVIDRAWFTRNVRGYWRIWTKLFLLCTKAHSRTFILIRIIAKEIGWILFHCIKRKVTLRSTVTTNSIWTNDLIRIVTDDLVWTFFVRCCALRVASRTMNKVCDVVIIHFQFTDFFSRTMLFTCIKIVFSYLTSIILTLGVTKWANMWIRTSIPSCFAFSVLLTLTPRATWWNIIKYFPFIKLGSCFFTRALLLTSWNCS